MFGLAYMDNGAGTLLKRGLLVFIIVLFYCDIAIYLSLAVSARAQPQYWIGLLVIFGGILAWVSPRTRWEVFRTPLFLWCALFMILTLLFFVVIPTSHIEQLKERIRDVVLLTTFVGIFLMLPRDMSLTRKVVLLAVVLGAVINLISLVHGNFLRPPGVETPYQPAGFYINANESAIALLLGLVLSVSVLRQRWREPYAILVLAGVAATFSREGVLGWVVVAIILCALRVLRWKRLTICLSGLVVFSGVITLIVAKFHVISEASLYYYYHSGVQKFTGYFQGQAMGHSETQRLQVLKKGWAIFLQHPWVGNGIGSTYHWSLPVSTHNMYLLYMDDYGVIGFFLYPLLIWAMIRKAAAETRKLAWTMAILLLFWGFFDHNVVQNYYSLFAISMTAAMSRLSAHKSELGTNPVVAQARTG